MQQVWGHGQDMGDYDGDKQVVENQGEIAEESVLRKALPSPYMPSIAEIR